MLDFYKKILLAVPIIALILFVIAIGLMRIEDSFKKRLDRIPENTIEAATDTPKNYFNKNIYSKMEIYNELVNAVDDFLYLLREKDYDKACSKMNTDYLYYKGISSLDEFKEYISVYGYDNASFNIIGYSKADLYNDEPIYVCKVITFTANMGDEYTTADEYLDSKKECQDTFVISLYEDDYSIAFEGFISKEILQKTERVVNSLIAFTPISKYVFDNMTVFEVMFENLSYTELNPSDMIISIVAEDSSSDFYWADSLPNTKEYELSPGEALNYYIYLKHGDSPIDEVTITFRDNFKMSPIIF